MGWVICCAGTIVYGEEVTAAVSEVVATESVSVCEAVDLSLIHN